MIDRLSFRFDDEKPVEHVDDIHGCLERKLEEQFGPDSPQQGTSRWSRRLEVGNRLREIRSQCLP